MVAGDAGAELRDGVSSVFAPTTTAITFRDLSTHGPAVLTLGCGVGPVREEPRPAAVRFRVEAADGDERLFTLFERSFRPEDLAPPERVAWFELALPGAERSSWTLRLTTEARSPARAGTGTKPITWPAWFTPVLRSRGRRVPLDEHPIPVVRVTRDLVADFADARVLEEPPHEPVERAVLDPAEGLRNLGGPRTAIVTPAPARVRLPVEVPADATLDFRVGMDTRRGWRVPGDGVTFALELAGERVWSRVVDAHARTLDRGWHRARVDLSPWEGREVDVDLVTEPGPTTEGDVGGWAAARVLRRTPVRRLAEGEATHVVLIVVDTLRADALGCYGGPQDATPTLDAMARQGVFAAEARSVSSFTWPATGSILTGVYPAVHGVLGDAGQFLLDGVETVAEVLEGNGYTTGAFVANPLITEGNNFDQGFETFASLPNVDGEALNDHARLWLDDTEGTTRFLYLHYLDPHSPYRAPPDFAVPGAPPRELAPEEEASVLAFAKRSHRWDPRRRDEFLGWIEEQRRHYAAEVRYLDWVVSDLLDELRERDVLEDAIVVVTSDHGEAFYEHGLPFHGVQLYEESVRVPLWFTGYGRAALSPRRVDRPADVRDVLPTLCELLGIEAPRAHDPGRSLLAPAEPEPLFAEVTVLRGHGAEERTRSRRLSVLASPWKLAHHPEIGTSELYHLDRDPAELEDLSAEHPELEERLLRLLEDWLARMDAASRSSVELRDANLHALEQLGYIGR